eukprot:GHVN01049662.1.p1 GENE.GHVN01049662.1~~GHVN01049662.1.p1  ORF type:complete len:287 (-),score=68.15 GHVN01049662.1:45-905(-)
MVPTHLTHLTHLTLLTNLFQPAGLTRLTRFVICLSLITVSSAYEVLTSEAFINEIGYYNTGCGYTSPSVNPLFIEVATSVSERLVLSVHDRSTGSQLGDEVEVNPADPVNKALYGLEFVVPSPEVTIRLGKFGGQQEALHLISIGNNISVPIAGLMPTTVSDRYLEEGDLVRFQGHGWYLGSFAFANVIGGNSCTPYQPNYLQSFGLPITTTTTHTITTLGPTTSTMSDTTSLAGQTTSLSEPSTTSFSEASTTEGIITTDAPPSCSTKINPLAIITSLTLLTSLT